MIKNKAFCFENLIYIRFKFFIEIENAHFMLRDRNEPHLIFYGIT